MKRLASILLYLHLVVAFTFAQEHLKFMGIPLNGTINQFQTKLAQKGVAVDTELSRKLDMGCRAFNGSFSSKRATIYVYYDETTKVVYRAKAVISSSERSLRDQNYEYFVSMLSVKYDDAEISKSEHNSHEEVSYLIPRKDELSDYMYLGGIDVYCSNFGLNYGVHVDYIDTINNVKHENRNMDDL